MTSRRAVKLTELNPHLLCVLCGGYYIDATTIIECLHSFCRRCIVRYLETSKYCPICDVMVHKTKPLLNIKPDHVLQDLVYKLVPGLFTQEMIERQDYLLTHPEARGGGGARSPGVGRGSLGRAAARAAAPAPDSASPASLAPVDHQVWMETTTDRISLALQFSPDGKPVTGSSADTSQTPLLQKRFLWCPASFTIRLLKKFIRTKFDIPSSYQMDVFHNVDPLTDRHTLMDVAYVYNWKRIQPLDLYFTVYHLLPAVVKPKKLLPAVTVEEPKPLTEAVEMDSEVVEEAFKQEPKTPPRKPLQPQLFVNTNLPVLPMFDDSESEPESPVLLKKAPRVLESSCDALQSSSEEEEDDNGNGCRTTQTGTSIVVSIPKSLISQPVGTKRKSSQEPSTARKKVKKKDKSRKSKEYVSTDPETSNSSFPMLAHEKRARKRHKSKDSSHSRRSHKSHKSHKERDKSKSKKSKHSSKSKRKHSKERHSKDRSKSRSRKEEKRRRSKSRNCSDTEEAEGQPPAPSSCKRSRESSEETIIDVAYKAGDDTGGGVAPSVSGPLTNSPPKETREPLLQTLQKEQDVWKEKQKKSVDASEVVDPNGQTRPGSEVVEPPIVTRSRKSIKNGDSSHNSSVSKKLSNGVKDKKVEKQAPPPVDKEEVIPVKEAASVPNTSPSKDNDVKDKNVNGRIADKLSPSKSTSESADPTSKVECQGKFQDKFQEWVNRDQLKAKASASDDKPDEIQEHEKRNSAESQGQTEIKCAASPPASKPTKYGVTYSKETNARNLVNVPAPANHNKALTSPKQSVEKAKDKPKPDPKLVEKPRCPPLTLTLPNCVSYTRSIDASKTGIGSRSTLVPRPINTRPLTSSCLRIPDSFRPPLLSHKSQSSSSTQTAHRRYSGAMSPRPAGFTSHLLVRQAPVSPKMSNLQPKKLSPLSPNKSLHTQRQTPLSPKISNAAPLVAPKAAASPPVESAAAKPLASPLKDAVPDASDRPVSPLTTPSTVTASSSSPPLKARTLTIPKLQNNAETTSVGSTDLVPRGAGKAECQDDEKAGQCPNGASPPTPPCQSSKGNRERTDIPCRDTNGRVSAVERSSLNGNSPPKAHGEISRRTTQRETTNGNTQKGSNDKQNLEQSHCKKIQPFHCESSKSPCDASRHMSDDDFHMRSVKVVLSPLRDAGYPCTVASSRTNVPVPAPAVFTGAHSSAALCASPLPQKAGPIPVIGRGIRPTPGSSHPSRLDSVCEKLSQQAQMTGVGPVNNNKCKELCAREPVSAPATPFYSEPRQVSPLNLHISSKTISTDAH